MRRRDFVAAAAAVAGSAGAGSAVGGLALSACATTAAAVDPTKPLFSGLTAFDGGKVTPPAVLGHVTLIDFWASWCGPCRQAFAHLDQLYRTYQKDGLEMLGICVDSDALAGRRFWASMRPRFAIAWDAHSEVSARFKVQSLPTTVLLDQDGMIVQRNEGFDLVDHRLMEEQIHRLLRA